MCKSRISSREILQVSIGIRRMQLLSIVVFVYFSQPLLALAEVHLLLIAHFTTPREDKPERVVEQLILYSLFYQCFDPRRLGFGDLWG